MKLRSGIDTARSMGKSKEDLEDDRECECEHESAPQRERFWLMHGNEGIQAPKHAAMYDREPRELLHLGPQLPLPLPVAPPASTYVQSDFGTRVEQLPLEVIDMIRHELCTVVIDEHIDFRTFLCSLARRIGAAAREPGLRITKSEGRYIQQLLIHRPNPHPNFSRWYKMQQLISMLNERILRLFDFFNLVTELFGKELADGVWQDATWDAARW